MIHHPDPPSVDNASQETLTIVHTTSDGQGTKVTTSNGQTGIALNNDGQAGIKLKLRISDLTVYNPLC